jgi:hypothetical protein
MSTTVKRSEIEAWRMYAGAEDMYPTVIDRGWRVDWTGTGWVNVRPANADDKQNYPTVVEDQ